MALQNQPVYGVPGDKQSANLGIFAKRGGIILTPSVNHLDQYLFDANGNQQYFKWVHIGSGGDFAYETPDGQVDAFFGLADNTFLPIVGRRVYSSAVFDGEAITTTCSNITWHGGE